MEMLADHYHEMLVDAIRLDLFMIVYSIPQSFREHNRSERTVPVFRPITYFPATADFTLVDQIV